MTQPTPSAAVDELLAREAICDCLHRSALGNDTCDRELWKSTYWPDGFEDHGNFTGNAHEFVDTITPVIQTAMDATWHHVSNTVIRLVATNRAIVHSYALVYCRMVGEADHRWDLIAGVRYLDRFEKRGAEWRIYERITKTDWMREEANSLDWSRRDPHTGRPMPLGMRGSDDPVHALFPADGVSSIRRGFHIA
jgi:hypothetical protein